MSKQNKVFWFTVCYILGIISFLSNSILIFTAILFTCSIYLFFFKKQENSIFIFILLAAFIIGIINTSLNTRYDDSLVPFADKDITATAKVITIPSNCIKDRTKFYAKVSEVRIDNNTKFLNNTTKVFITINDKNERISNIKIGDTLQIKGRLKIPQYSQNPSQFDYFQYLRYKKTFSLLYADEDWTIIKRADDNIGKIVSKLNDTREKILKIHAQNIKSPMIEILGGIIFGDDAVNPDEETKEIFINSGIFHILSASGMNVTLIFGIWYFFAKHLRFNYKFSIIAGILLIMFYTFTTGFGPPIIRAVSMLTLILIGKLIDRETSTIALLFAVALLMLLFNPLMLFDIGFQLSFIVTFSLILTAPLISFKTNYKWINNIISLCFIPLIAQIYAAPFQMFYFNTFTLYSVFANIAIIPVLSIVSFIGFMSSILALIPSISQNICFISDFILNPLLVYIVKIAEFFSNLPNSIVYLKKPSILQILLYYSIIVSLTLIIKYKITNKKILNTFLIILTFFIISFIHIPSKNPEIIYFSTGNADSFLIKSPNNEYFMIDTGKNGYKGSIAPANNIIIKYLKDKGVKNIEALILSHFDADHAGGSIDVLKNLHVKTLYITDVYENTSIYESIINYAQDNKIKTETITDTKEIYNQNNFKIRLLKPKGELIKSENQKSLIVHFSYFNQNFLFMGDGDINSYNSLSNEYKKNIKIIKSGHHGAKNTVNKEMADNSEIFILSTGYNFYNHPHNETIKQIIDSDKIYFRTDYSNAIKAVILKDKTLVFQYSPVYKKFKPAL